jgi:all-trans-retinol 13,14-reductase
MKYDYVIIGAGIGGIFTGALLSQTGQSVCILEQHTEPGGYGHSFKRKGYIFCAELHYIWNCGPDEDCGYIFRRLGIEHNTTFSPLNPECFDRFDFPGFSYKLKKGFDKNINCLSKDFPGHLSSIKRYYDIIGKLHDEMKALPPSLSFYSILPKFYRFRNIIKYRNWTTQDLFNSLDFPLELQSILAGQSGNLLVSPERASLLVHSAMVTGLDRGACVPEKSYKHIFDTLSDYIDSHSNCKVILGTEIVKLKNDQKKVTGVISKSGKEFSGKWFIYNGDPTLLKNLISNDCLNKSFNKKISYDYSPSAFTIYLGLKSLNLKDYGFGSWNVWHYSDPNINNVFKKQLNENNYNDPSLFISTPTLHRGTNTIAPQGCDQMVICTLCNYNYFETLYNKSREIYIQEKKRITEIILDKIRSQYINDLYDHIDLSISGTPLTMERFVFAPKGNSYGADLTPSNYKLGKVDYRTPISNLFLIGATAGIPSFAGGVHFAGLLYEKLTGNSLLPR